MNKTFIVGAAVAAGAIAVRALAAGPRSGAGSPLRRPLLRRMERMLAMLPETAPPRLVMSHLPRLREQNDQIVAMLAEQNALLHALLAVSRPASEESR